MLSKILKSLRKSKGLRPEETAFAMGLSEKHLHYLERNEGVYSEYKLAKHAEALNYRVELHFIDLEDVRNVTVYEVKTESLPK